VTRREIAGVWAMADRHVSFDRVVSSEPLTFAAGAAGMDFELCFGTARLKYSEPSGCDGYTTKLIVQRILTGINADSCSQSDDIPPCEASAAPAAYIETVLPPIQEWEMSAFGMSWEAELKRC